MFKNHNRAKTASPPNFRLEPLPKPRDKFDKATEMEMWSVDDRNSHVEVEAVITTVKRKISNPSGPKQVGYQRTFNPFMNVGHTTG